MLKELEVLHTQTYDRRPLATLRNLPGNDADMTPAQMRELAAALLTAADECEQRPMDRRHFSRTVKRYPMTPNMEYGTEGARG